MEIRVFPKRLLAGVLLTALWLSLPSQFASAQEATLIVSPDNMQGWTLRRESPGLSPGTGEFVTGPQPAPAGDGSLRLTVTSASVGESITRPMPRIRFSDLTTLTYHTYRASGGTAQAVTLQFSVCRSYWGSICIASSRLIYEPYWTGTYPSTGIWEEWNALAPNARWWMTNIDVNATCGRDNACTVAQLLTTYPNLDIYNSNNIGVLLKIGSGWAAFDGYVDKLTLGINGVNTTYDFEPAFPSAVTLAAFEARWQGDAVLITWETAMELDNLGFNLYRSDAPAGPWTRLNAELIPSQNPGAVFGAVYEWRDAEATPGAPVYYRLEDLDIHGASAFHGPISAAPTEPSAVTLIAFGARSPVFGLALALGSLALFTGLKPRR